MVEQHQVPRGVIERDVGKVDVERLEVIQRHEARGAEEEQVAAVGQPQHLACRHG